MGRDRGVSRSPSYKRYSQSPSPVRSGRESRKSRDCSHIRKPNSSLSPGRHSSRSPVPRHRLSRSPSPKETKRQQKGGVSTSPLTMAPRVTSVTKEAKNYEMLRKEEELKKRRQEEAELKLIEEETAKRVAEAIPKKVQEALDFDSIRLEINKRLKEGREKLIAEVAAQLQKEKEHAFLEARKKEEQAQRERDEMERIIEENRKKVEEAQRLEALERQKAEEERYRELEELQKKKEEALRRKKEEEEEERAKQMKLLGKDKSRPKLSFALGLKNK